MARFILINTSHAGNVGAAARALKVMGFGELFLVAPRDARVLGREETIQRASGATDVLKNAQVVATLDEALHGVQHLCATAMTPRDFGPPTYAPRAYFEMLLKSEQNNKEIRREEANLTEMTGVNTPSSAGKTTVPSMGFLFGSEKYGMRNEDVYRCHACLSIPTAPNYGSLNLASAVQLIAYEWRLALGGFAVQSATAPAALADAASVQGMLNHLEAALVDIGFLDPQAPKKLMPRLAQLFNRAALTPEEIHILRGVAKAMQTAKNR
jgi:tRNA/rRNA methyltransferase